MFHLIAVGRMKDRVERDLFERYANRISPRIKLTELAEGRGAPNEIKRREGQAILAALPSARLLSPWMKGGGPTIAWPSRAWWSNGWKPHGHYVS